MSTNKTREAIAYERASILNPVLNNNLDRASCAKAMREIHAQTGISERTLRRWRKAYLEYGFDGLLPAERDLSKYRAIPESVVDQAVILRREVPERSVSDIILLLELEGVIKPGEVKRTTLQDQFWRRGYSARQLKMYSGLGVGAARRFQRTGRNDLWQADIKYLLKLPATANRPARQLYVSAFIDDATRFVTGVRVYDKQDVFCVLDCFRRALETHGVPDRLYTDNGRVYLSRQLISVCTKLGIRLLRAKPYSPEGKGKIEAFNKTLDKFVKEALLERPTSLEKVQHDLDCWLDAFYYQKEHTALKGKTPEQAYYENSKVQRFVSQDELNRAFRLTETRLVDKTGCLSFAGIRFEAGPEYIGLKVDVSFASDSRDMLTLEYPGMEAKVIYPLQITEHTKPRLKATPLLETDSSRVLTAAREAREEQVHVRQGATSFRDI